MADTTQPQAPTAPSRWVVGVKINGSWDIEIAGPSWDQAVAAAMRIALRHMPEHLTVLPPEHPNSDEAIFDVLGQLPARGFQDHICEDAKDYSGIVAGP